MNRSLFQYIFRLSKNTYIANIALFFSYDFLVIIITALLVWSLSMASRKVYSFTLIFGSGLSSVFLAEILKHIFVIDRPFRVLEIAPLVRSIGLSFPSGHAAFMASLAVAGYALNPKLGVTLGVFAVFVGLSRIVIGVHYPLDVLVGWLLGVLVGVLFVTFLPKI